MHLDEKVINCRQQQQESKAKPDIDRTRTQTIKTADGTVHRKVVDDYL